MAFSMALHSASQRPLIPSTVVARRRPLAATIRRRVRHLGVNRTSMQQCEAVSTPHVEGDSQGNNPELSYEATEKVLIEEKLKAMELKRELQLLQARIAHNEAITKKATRVITKGIRRCRESRSSARLLETKLALASETQALGLLNTIDEKQEDLQRTQEEVSLFKELFLRTKEEEEQEAYERRKAMAATVEAQKRIQQLERQMQKDLEWYEDMIDTGRVFGRYLFELCIKAIPLTSPATSNHASQQGQHAHSSKPRAANVQTKQHPRFL